jgi:hypothetical protein
VASAHRRRDLGDRQNLGDRQETAPCASNMKASIPPAQHQVESAAPTERAIAPGQSLPDCGDAYATGSSVRRANYPELMARGRFPQLTRDPVGRLESGQTLDSWWRIAESDNQSMS